MKAILIVFFSHFFYSASAQDYTFRPDRNTPLEFVEKIKFDETAKLNLLKVSGNFPKNWITENDVEKLIPLISSKQPAKCYMNIFSSYIPNEKADIGGFAIILINSFRNNKQLEFGLTNCPISNEKDVTEILNWWENFKMKN